MTKNDDNIVEFKAKTKAVPEADAKAALKKEMMARIFEGSKRLHQQVRNEHVAYYGMLLLGFLVIITMVLIARFVG